MSAFLEGNFIQVILLDEQTQEIQIMISNFIKSERGFRICDNTGRRQTNN